MPYTPQECEKCGLVGSWERRVWKRADGRKLCSPCRPSRERPVTASCSACEETLSSSEFYWGKNGSLSTPRCKACTLERLRFRKYGITPEQVEARTREQGGRCAICARERKLYVDHCHQGGHVRGLLCRTCNIGLGAFEDQADWLLAAATYVVAQPDVLAEVSRVESP